MRAADSPLVPLDTPDATTRMVAGEPHLLIVIEPIAAVLAQEQATGFDGGLDPGVEPPDFRV